MDGFNRRLVQEKRTKKARRRTITFEDLKVSEYEEQPVLKERVSRRVPLSEERTGTGKRAGVRLPSSRNKIRDFQSVAAAADAISSVSMKEKESLSEIRKAVTDNDLAGKDPGELLTEFIRLNLRDKVQYERALEIKNVYHAKTNYELCMIPTPTKEEVAIYNRHQKKKRMPTREDIRQLKPIILRMTKAVKEERQAIETNCGVSIISPSSKRERYRYVDHATNQEISPEAYTERLESFQRHGTIYKRPSTPPIPVPAEDIRSEQTGGGIEHIESQQAVLDVRESMFHDYLKQRQGLEEACFQKCQQLRSDLFMKYKELETEYSAAQRQVWKAYNEELQKLQGAYVDERDSVSEQMICEHKHSSTTLQFPQVDHSLEDTSQGAVEQAADKEPEEVWSDASDEEDQMNTTQLDQTISSFELDSDLLDVESEGQHDPVAVSPFSSDRGDGFPDSTEELDKENRRPSPNKPIEKAAQMKKKKDKYRRRSFLIDDDLFN